MQPSKAYAAAIAEGAKHHADNKTYSGSLLRPHKPFLTDMIERLDCRSALDVGAGKGTQYAWRDPFDGKRTLEEAWGFPVRKYDPCWPPYASDPGAHESFDLVICTHTASLIPFPDLYWFLDRLLHWAGKGVFIAEKIGERKKHEVGDGRPIGWTVRQWTDYIGPIANAYPKLEVVLSVREILPRGRITTRYIWRGGGFAKSIEAEPRDDN